MGVVVHDGGAVPTDPDPWDPYDKGYVWVTWADALNGQTITGRDWLTPTGWTQSNPLQGQSVTDRDGTTHTDCEGVQLETTHTAGVYQITNRVTLSNGDQIKRSVRIKVGQL